MRCGREPKRVVARGGGWWNQDHGYSYWSEDGSIFHNDEDRDYGEQLDQDDIVDIWLDLKDGKRELSYARNNQHFGKAFDVKEATEYKLVALR